MIDGKIVGKIEDIDKRADLQFVTIDYDVQAIKDYIKGFIENESDKMLFDGWVQEQIYGFFTKQNEDGDYLEIYAFEGSVPYLHKGIYLIQLNKGMCLMETTMTTTQAENAGLCWACDDILEYHCIKRGN